MRVLRRLEEIDRRLGLSPRPDDGPERRRSWLAYPVLGLFVVQLILVLGGRSSWITAVNVAAVCAVVPAVGVGLFLEGRRRRGQ